MLASWAGQGGSGKSGRSGRGREQTSSSRSRSGSGNEGRLVMDNELLNNTQCCCAAVCGWDLSSQSARLILTSFEDLFAEEIEQDRLLRERIRERGLIQEEEEGGENEGEAE